MSLRSPHPHARIVSIDTARAAKMPGVLLILTGADVVADGLRPIPHIPTAMSPPDIALYNLDGSELMLERPMILATETVRHVGEAVAFVVAETVAQAKDAAEAIEVVYEPLPPISDIAVDARVGNPPATRAGFAEAEHVVRLETHIQRVTGVPMEPRSALGAYDPASGRYTLYAGGGAIVRPKKELAIILGLEPEQVRVIAKEVGGNFGTRNYLYPEFVLVAWAAQEDRPAGQMDLRARRGVPQRLCRPRSHGRGRARGLVGRPLPRPAFDQHQQCRRLHRVLHPADQGHAADDQRLPHAGGGAGAGGAEQHASAPRPIAAPAGPRPCS